MNRREAIQAAVAAVATGGIEVAAKEIAVELDSEPVAFVFKTTDKLDPNHVRNIHDSIKAVFANTKWASIPAIVLDERADFNLMRVPKEMLP